MDDYKKDGGGDFIIRGYISPITAVQCKLQIGLTPISGDKVQELDDGHTTIIRYLHDGDQRIHRTISYSIGSFMADIVDESTQNKFLRK